MPNIVAHYLLGKRLIEYIKKEYELESIDETALLWGAQGPDFLWSANCCLESCKNVFNLATDIHKQNPNDTLSFLSNFARGANNPVELGYLLGFYSHYAFDSIAHPFVNFGAEEMVKNSLANKLSTAHAIIEINLDTIILRYEKGSLPNELPLKKCLPKDEKVIGHMALFYSLLAKQVFSQDIAVDKIADAARKFCKYVKRSFDPIGVKRDFAIKVEKAKHKEPFKSLSYRPITEDDSCDFANILNNEWIQNGKTRTESFLDLFEEAFNLVKAMADCYFENGKLENLTQNRPFV